MEKVAAIGNSRSLFRPNRNTGSQNPGVNELMKETNGSLIQTQERRLTGWAWHFYEQCIWPLSTTGLLTSVMVTALVVDIFPPSKAEVVREISYLKRHKAAGPDGLPPFVFECGSSTLLLEMTKLDLLLL
ncbi:hypothetical protein D915_010813 [Fasciola hepatica]|uniref:Uncharacterized protein n=1 Tax=Fasciola hepatica TaxID=6192 RepID=A0A4E0QUH8_FASHE|nr:hypothetical protein D915_010813 [Fasciola hepatica]